MRTTTTTTTTTNHQSFTACAYVWAKYQDGALDVVWANDSDHAAATYGRFVIDPTLRTVYRYETADDAEYAALAGGGPGSEDYWIVDDTDPDTGDAGYAAYRNDRSDTRVGTSDDWRTLAQAVNDDMDEQGIYGSVFLESRYCPDLLTFVGLPDGPLTFKMADDIPVATDDWTF